MSKLILSVSYDEPLLNTRQRLLERDGYAVTSALGFAQALANCKGGAVDLLILGSSIPDADNGKLIRPSEASALPRYSPYRVQMWPTPRDQGPGLIIDLPRKLNPLEVFALEDSKRHRVSPCN